MARHSAESAVIEEKLHFEKLLRDLVRQPRHRQQGLAKKAIHLAVNSSTGYYSSEALESVFTRIAEEIDCPELENTYRKDSILHVMTESYATGGHTRVVERWVKLSEGEQHSLVLTSNCHQTVPDELVAVIKAREGKIIRLEDSLNDIEKGIELRCIASEYERIVLHVHMHDVVPLIAFGTDKFKRPVILFNHADHLFWVGVSIADVIADLRSWGQALTLDKRGAKNSFILGIPGEASITSLKNDREQIRQKLGIDPGRKLILSAGAPHKYIQLGQWNFTLAITRILENNPDAFFVCIGPRPEELPGWAGLSKRFRERCVALGSKSPEELHEWMAASDLYLDSFPMSGGTALGNAVAIGTPCLAMKSVTGHLDYVLKTGAYCDSLQELQQKASLLLQDSDLAEHAVQELQGALESSEGISVWKQRVAKLYQQMGSKHTVTDFQTTPSPDVDALALFISSFNKRRKILRRIPSVFSLYHYKRKGKRKIGMDFEFLRKS